MSEEKIDIGDEIGNSGGDSSNQGTNSRNAFDMIMQLMTQMREELNTMNEQQNMKQADLTHQLAGVVQEITVLNRIQQSNQDEIAKLKEDNASPSPGENRVNSVAFSNMLPTTPHGNKNSLRRESFFGINRQQGNMRTMDSQNQGSIGEKVSSRSDLHLSVPLPQTKFPQRDVVTVNTVLIAEDQQREDNRASFGLGGLNLDEYFKLEACKGLIKNDKKMKVAHSLHLDERTWNGIDDETFLDMCARKIRSMKRTKEGFLEIFVDGLGKFTLGNSEQRWEVGVIGWSKHAEKPLDDHIVRSRRVYSLMMRGKQYGEEIPPETYQTKDDPGLINAYLTVIKALEAYVKHYMGGDKSLKAIKSFSDFLDRLDLMNVDLASQDEELIKKNSKLVPPPTIADIVQKVQDKQSQQGRRAHYEKTRDAIEKRLSVGHLHRQEAVCDTSVDTEDGDGNSGYASIFPIDFDDSSFDLPSDLYNALKTIPQDVLRSVVDEHQRDQQESSHDEIARLEFSSASRDKYPSTPDKKDMACYTQMRYGSCDKANCGYDHDGKKAQAKLMEELKKLLQSPYADKNQIGTMLRESSSGNSKQGNPLPSNTGIPRFAPSSRPPGQQRTNFQPSAGKLQEMSGVTSVAFDTSSEVLTHK